MKKGPPKRFVVSRRQVYWLSFAAFLLAASVAAVVDFWDQKILRQESRYELYEELQDIESALEYRLSRRVEMTAGLTSYIQNVPNLTQAQFNALAKRLAVMSHGLAGIQLEKNEKISHVYPEDEFKELAGKMPGEIFGKEDKAGWLSIRERKDRHSSPGILAYRAPIRIHLKNDGPLQQDSIWGYVIYLLDVSQIIATSGLVEKHSSMDIAITFKPKGQDKAIVFGRSKVLTEDPVELRLSLPGGDWLLAGIDPGWQNIMNKHRLRRRIILGLAVLFFTLWAYSLLSKIRAHGLISDVEAARLESEKQFEFLIREAAVDPISIVDQEGKILEFNQEATRSLGYSRHELSNMTVFDIDCAHSREEIEKGLKELKPGQIAYQRTCYRRKDGSEFPVELRLGVVDTQNGLRIIYSTRDITAQRQYEEQLENINRDKDKFFSIIAHDLRGPLSGFLGLTEMLEQDSDSFSKEDLKMLGAEMRKAGENLFNLLEDLLDWSRLQMGRIEPKIQNFAISDLIEANISLLGVNARNKEISLTSRCEGDLAVSADLDMINTVIRNLISNAVKFTHRGGSVRIQAEQEKDHIRVQVTDTGIGMTAEQAKSIFTPGSAHRSEGTEKEPGTGLGLMLCHELIKRNGGQLEVTSEPAKGSTFTFTLPTATKDGPETTDYELSAVTKAPFKRRESGA